MIALVDIGGGFDTTRGINSGNDAHLRLNVTNSQGSDDLIDPLDAGFSVASGTTNVNYSGGTGTYSLPSPDLDK